MSNWNDGVIEEFRATGGRVTGFENQPVLLLHHKGARTGTERVSPLAYLKLSDGYAVFASKGGADTNPDWYYNVKANPDVEVEVGATSEKVRAREAQGQEHDRIWSEQKQFNRAFASYEKRTSRDRIPVIVLETV